MFESGFFEVVDKVLNKIVFHPLGVRISLPLQFGVPRTLLIVELKKRTIDGHSRKLVVLVNVFNINKI